MGENRITRFVLWGNGRLGRDVFAILGKDRVAAFIEKDEQLQGSQYHGTPVISFGDYEENYIQYPIIVTPNDYEEEISRFLEERGIYNYFLNSVHMRYLVRVLLQMDIQRFMQDIPRDEEVLIYGYTPAGILLYEYLAGEGYECRMAIKEKNGVSPAYISGSLHIPVRSLSEADGRALNIILTDLVAVEDEWILETGGQVKDFLNAEDNDALFEHKELEVFKGIHCKERCFIVGTGPSLRISDLDTLHRQQEVCFSVNGIFKAFSDTAWRPDYYIVSDPSAIVRWKKEIFEMDVREKFIADWAFFFQESVENVHKWHKNTEWDEKSLPLFSEDFTKCLYYGSTVVYKAMQVAVYMGFQEIYLLGVDCNWENGGKNHFVEGYDVHKSAVLHVEMNQLAYQAAYNYAKEHDLKIYNATRGGQLEIFDRVDFDTLF